MTKKGKIITWTSVSAILLLSLFVFIKFFFPYGEGVDEGDIIYFQKEGFVFKTYEGKMIQTGFKNAKVQGSMHSNEFKFSVVDERVARQLIEGDNIGVKLHFKRYLGSLPWRGNSQYVVDSVFMAPQNNRMGNSVHDNNFPIMAD